MSWIIALLVLSFLIFFHELGHYSAARFFGVYVEVFSIGFGKKIASFKLFNSEWRISMIPLGGYVKMKGQEDLDPTARSSDDDSYNSKKPWQRIIILLAGPGANFLIAFFLFLAIGFGSPRVLSPVIGNVLANSPAAKAGLESNDTIVAVNGIKVDTWQKMAKTIQKSSIAPINLEVARKDIVLNMTLTPELKKTKNMFNEDIKRPMIGIAAAGVTHRMQLGFLDTFKYAFNETYKASSMIFVGLKKLVVGDVPAKEMGGVISIVKVTSDAASAGWMAVFFFAALISVNLGILNLLPIPALDGGHIMFNLYEMITSKVPSEAVLIKLTMAGWVFLLGLMGLGIFNDINRLIG